MKRTAWRKQLGMRSRLVRLALAAALAMPTGLPSAFAFERADAVRPRAAGQADLAENLIGRELDVPAHERLKRLGKRGAELRRVIDEISQLETVRLVLARVALGEVTRPQAIQKLSDLQKVTPLSIPPDAVAKVPLFHEAALPAANPLTDLRAALIRDLQGKTLTPYERFDAVFLRLHARDYQLAETLRSLRHLRNEQDPDVISRAVNQLGVSTDAKAVLRLAFFTPGEGSGEPRGTIFEGLRTFVRLAEGKPGFSVTVDAFAKARGLSRDAAYLELRGLVDAGILRVNKPTPAPGQQGKIPYQYHFVDRLVAHPQLRQELLDSSEVQQVLRLSQFTRKHQIQDAQEAVSKILARRETTSLTISTSEAWTYGIISKITLAYPNADVGQVTGAIEGAFRGELSENAAIKHLLAQGIGPRFAAERVVEALQPTANALHDLLSLGLPSLGIEAHVNFVERTSTGEHLQVAYDSALRNMAIIADRDVAFQDLIEAIRAALPPVLTEVFAEHVRIHAPQFLAPSSLAKTPERRRITRGEGSVWNGLVKAVELAGDRHDYSTTVADFARARGVSRSTAAAELAKLVHIGIMRRERDWPRGRAFYRFAPLFDKNLALRHELLSSSDLRETLHIPMVGYAELLKMRTAVKATIKKHKQKVHVLLPEIERQARRPIVGANWKMALTEGEAKALLLQMADGLSPRDHVDIFVAPSFPHLKTVGNVLRQLELDGLLPPGRVQLAAQDVSAEEPGAWTGQVSYAQLNELGVTYVIIGHSEQRHGNLKQPPKLGITQSNEVVNAKVKTALAHGLKPVVAVGENAEEYRAGKTQTIIGEQLRKSLAGLTPADMANVVIAYEPIWAIGTGLTATPEQADAVQQFIRGVLLELFGQGVAGATRIQYGGSVKPDNVAGLITQPNIDGGLIGGASLKAQDFVAIARAINEFARATPEVSTPHPVLAEAPTPADAGLKEHRSQEDAGSRPSRLPVKPYFSAISLVLAETPADRLDTPDELLAKIRAQLAHIGLPVGKLELKPVSEAMSVREAVIGGKLGEFLADALQAERDWRGYPQFKPDHYLWIRRARALSWEAVTDYVGTLIEARLPLRLEPGDWLLLARQPTGLPPEFNAMGAMRAGGERHSKPVQEILDKVAAGDLPADAAIDDLLRLQGLKGLWAIKKLASLGPIAEVVDDPGLPPYERIKKDSADRRAVDMAIDDEAEAPKELNLSQEKLQNALAESRLRNDNADQMVEHVLALIGISQDALQEASGLTANDTDPVQAGVPVEYVSPAPSEETVITPAAVTEHAEAPVQPLEPAERVSTRVGNVVIRLGVTEALDRIDKKYGGLPHLHYLPLPFTFRSFQARVGRLLSLPAAQRGMILNRYQRLLHTNRAALVEVFGQQTMERFEHIAATDRLTSFPAEELLAVRYLEVFEPERWEREVGRLQSEVPALTAALPHEELFRALDAAAGRLARRVQLREDERDQVTQELRLRLYRELLARPDTEARTVELGLSTSRDGQQSNLGTRLSGEDQRRIIDLQAELGTIRTMETWGGAVPQAALLKSLRGDHPEDPWVNLRAQTALLRNKLEALLLPYRAQISAADWRRLFDRYRVSTDRRILTDKELTSLLAAYPFMAPDTALGRQVSNLYRIKQEMLLRGQYIVGLKAYPKSMLGLFVRTAYKNGVEIFRIFDALNDARQILAAVDAAKAAGAQVQPAIHYTTDFPLGIPGYVELAERLVERSGDALDALVIKDAGGLLEPGEAFELVRALRERFRARGWRVPIQLHTHDTRGNRQLTLLEAIRANGSEDLIVVDLAVGKGGLSAPFAQPDLRDFLTLVEGANWQGSVAIDHAALTHLEQVIAEEILPRYPQRLPVTTKDRRDLVRARMPGGMKTNFLDREFMYVFADHRKPDGGVRAGYASALVKPLFGLELFRDGTLTEDGRQFADAFLALVYEEMRQVTEDLGGISLVTPTSQWVGVQAFQNVINWLTNGWLRLERTPTGIALIQQESFPQERASRYAMRNSFSLGSDLQNYFLLWAQDPELQRLYPRADRTIVLKAFELLRDPDLDLKAIARALQAAQVDHAAIQQALSTYQPFLKSLDEPLVDLTVAKLKAAWRVTGRSEPVTRAALLTLGDNDPLISVPLTLEEVRARHEQARQRYPGLTTSDEDLLLMALFPRPDQALHLFAHRVLDVKREIARALAALLGTPVEMRSAIVQHPAGDMPIQVTVFQAHKETQPDPAAWPETLVPVQLDGTMLMIRETVVALREAPGRYQSFGDRGVVWSLEEHPPLVWIDVKRMTAVQEAPRHASPEMKRRYTQAMIGLIGIAGGAEEPLTNQEILDALNKASLHGDTTFDRVIESGAASVELTLPREGETRQTRQIRKPQGMSPTELLKALLGGAISPQATHWLEALRKLAQERAPEALERLASSQAGRSASEGSPPQENIAQGIEWKKRNEYIFGGGFGYDIRINDPVVEAVKSVEAILRKDEEGKEVVKKAVRNIFQAVYDRQRHVEEAVTAIQPYVVTPSPDTTELLTRVAGWVASADADATKFFYTLGRTLGSARYLNHSGRALITGDQRLTSDAFRLALIQGLLDEGVTVVTQADGEVITTGLPSRTGLADDYDLVIQVTGSHNPPQANGAKITYKGLPFFQEQLLRLSEHIEARAGWSPEVRPGTATKDPDLITRHVEGLAKVLPELVNPPSLIVDFRAGAAAKVFIGLAERKGYRVVRLDSAEAPLPDDAFSAEQPVLIVLNEQPSPRMEEGIWDPSKYQAFYGIQQLQERLYTDPRYRQGVDYPGVVFDGDGDRSGFITGRTHTDLRGMLVMPERMLNAFYQQMVLDNLEGIRALNRLGHTVKLALDVRSSKVIVDVLKRLVEEHEVQIAGEFIPAGYPSHRQFVLQELNHIERLLHERRADLQAGEVEAIQKLMTEYTSAETSGYFFFNVLEPRQFLEKKIVVDDGIVSAFRFLDLVARSGKTVREVDRSFPLLPVTIEVRLEKAPADVQKKQALAEQIILTFAERHPELIPMPVEELRQRIEAARQAPPARQGAEEPLLLVDGVRLQLTNGVWILLRKSNTSAVIVFKAEADSAAKEAELVRTVAWVKDATEAVRQMDPAFGPLELGDLKKELQRLEEEARRNALQKPPMVPESTLLRTIAPLLKTAPVEPPQSVEAQVQQIATVGHVAPAIARQLLLTSLNLDQFRTDLAEAGRLSAKALDARLNAAQLGPDSFSQLQDLDRWIEALASDLAVPVERIRWIVINAIQPIPFVNGLAQAAGTGDPGQLLNGLLQSGTLPSIVSRYLLGLVRTQAPDPARRVPITVADLVDPAALRYAGEAVDATVSFPSEQGGQLRVDQDAWEVLRYHFRVIRADSARRSFPYRGGVREYVETEFRAKIIPQLDEFIRRQFPAGSASTTLEYVVSSGIGANEQYTRQLAKLHNETTPAIRWIVVNNPAEWEEVRPVVAPDATAENTLFVDMSRSGDTQETAKTFEFTCKEFPCRVVAANKGPLRELAERENTQGNILLLPLRADLGGRLMRRLTPMVYASMYLVEMDLDAYVEATDRFDRALAFDQPGPNLAVNLAEWLLATFLLDGRSELAFLANGATPEAPLYRSMEELQQLWMEGAQKRGSPPAPMQVLLLPHHSHKTLEGILGQSDSYVGIVLLGEQSGARASERRLTTSDAVNPDHAGLSPDDVLYGLALGNADRLAQRMPTIMLGIKQPTLETAAALSTLYEDLSVHYTALTGQDPNSNPEVASVRQLGASRLAERATAVRQPPDQTGAQAFAEDEQTTIETIRQRSWESAASLLRSAGLDPAAIPKEFRGDAVTAFRQSYRTSDDLLIALLLFQEQVDETFRTTRPGGSVDFVYNALSPVLMRTLAARIALLARVSLDQNGRLRLSVRDDRWQDVVELVDVLARLIRESGFADATMAHAAQWVVAQLISHDESSDPPLALSRLLARQVWTRLEPALADAEGPEQLRTLMQDVDHARTILLHVPSIGEQTPGFFILWQQALEQLRQRRHLATLEEAARVSAVKVALYVEPTGSDEDLPIRARLRQWLDTIGRRSGGAAQPRLEWFDVVTEKPDGLIAIAQGPKVWLDTVAREAVIKVATDRVEPEVAFTKLETPRAQQTVVQSPAAGLLAAAAAVAAGQRRPPEPVAKRLGVSVLDEIIVVTPQLVEDEDMAGHLRGYQEALRKG